MTLKGLIGSQENWESLDDMKRIFSLRKTPMSGRFFLDTTFIISISISFTVIVIIIIIINTNSNSKNQMSIFVTVKH